MSDYREKVILKILQLLKFSFTKNVILTFIYYIFITFLKFTNYIHCHNNL